MNKSNEKKITIAHGYTSIEVFHSLLPFILSSKKETEYKFKFINYNLNNLYTCQGDLLILVRRYHDGKTSNENIISELKKLRKNFPKIVYFDDSAAASIVLFCTFPYVDEYWKRACLKNKENYKKKFYGGHIFSNYYANKFGINDKADYFINPIPDDQIQFDKLKVAWNIGIGIYPTDQKSILNKNYNQVRRFITGLTTITGVSFLQSFFEKNIKQIINELKNEININDRILKISSRFTNSSYRKSVGYQRELCAQMTKNDNLYLSGFIKKKDFTKEIFSIFGVLSPFGWGEVCYRDFEAIIAGAYLIKPNVSYLDTWPNIYEKEFYHSLDWDLSEIPKLNKIIDNLDYCEKSINDVRYYYRSCLKNIVPRCLKMIDNLFI